MSKPEYIKKLESMIDLQSKQIKVFKELSESKDNQIDLLKRILKNREDLIQLLENSKSTKLPDLSQTNWTC